MSTSPEYLKGFESPLLKGITWEQMVEERKVINPNLLKQILIEANQWLTTEPGPHLEDRQEGAKEWLEWWISYLEKFCDANKLTTGEKLIPSKKLLPLEDMSQEMSFERAMGETAGVLFMGGGEGHEGHRFAVSYMKQCVGKVVLLFEQEEYIQQKERGGSFLPLKVRLSMWSYFEKTDYISVIPQREENENLSFHYQNIFTQTNANYCFATEGDPYLLEKINRGEYAPFLVIPALTNRVTRTIVPRTTERVQKLMADVDLDADLDIDMTQ